MKIKTKMTNRFKTQIKITALGAFLAMGTSTFAEVSIMYPEWISTLVEPGIASYEAKTGDTVKSIRLPTEGYDRRIAVDLAAGTAADVAVMDSFMVAELASAGYLEALDAALASWDQFKYYMPGLLNVTSFNNKPYALPTDTDVRMLWYDKSVFADAGIKMPWSPKSWDDVLKTAKKIKQETDIDYAFVLPAGTKQGEAATMQGFYMALLGADTAKNDRNRLRDWDAGKWIGASPALTRTVELYHDVYVDMDLTDSSINYATDIGSAVREALANNQIGILASGSWEWACLFDCNGMNLPSVEERSKIIGWTPWPNSGVKGAPKSPNVSGGWSMGVNSSAKNKAASIALLTEIFDYKNFKPWIIEGGRMAARTDIAESTEYKSNEFLAKATQLAQTTAGRDTYPGYQVVSALIQDMTGAILDGVSVKAALKEYHDALVDEFGEENVLTIK